MHARQRLEPLAAALAARPGSDYRELARMARPHRRGDRRDGDRQAGTVRIDGHDVRDVTLEALGGHLGMVFQGHLPLPREPCRQPALRALRRERRRRW